MARPTQEQRITVAKRRQRALELQAAGYSRADIAAELGITEAHLSVDLQRARDYYIKMQAAAIEELRARELAALDRAQQVATEVMERDHLAHSNGRVVQYYDPERQEDVTVTDDGPKLAAVDRVVKISESRRKLLGQDAPSKVETQVGGSVEYIVRVSQEEMDAV